MSTEPQSAVPELTLGWRLKMALSHGKVSRREMAAHLGYEESALSRWMSDKLTPRNGVLSQWALATNVDPEWLRTGVGTPGPNPDPGGPRQSKDADLSRLTAQKRARARGADDGSGDATRAYPEAA